MRILEVKTAVFLEQTNQFLTGKSDIGKLAIASREASSSSQQIARVLAKIDAQMALAVRNEEGASAA